MNEDVLEQLRTQVRAPLVADKVTEDKRLKAEILLMRTHATKVEDKPGHFVCEGAYGRGVAEQKEATLYDLATQKPLRWQPYKSHLLAVHSALCWAVLGISIG
jgi:dethiobiotin synthetase